LSLLYRLNTSPIPAEELEFALETLRFVADNLTARFFIRIAQSLIIELVKQYINLNPPVPADEATDEVASDGVKSYHSSSDEEDADVSSKPEIICENILNILFDVLSTIGDPNSIDQAKAILRSHLEIIPNSEAGAKALQKVSKCPFIYYISPIFSHRSWMRLILWCHWASRAHSS
jgi:hypothetical protein